MKKSYVIIWVSVTGLRTGAGKNPLTQEDAENLVMELNRDHPEFIHRAVNTETEEVDKALLRAKELVFPAVEGKVVPLPLPEFAAAQAAAEEAEAI
ncbi:MAG: hypothetical protein JWM16_3189 [Verrucomicrobiales bacterium]|nr:hypothetical protein [Verrucomicrobiales bacterium]